MASHIVVLLDELYVNRISVSHYKSLGFFRQMLLPLKPKIYFDMAQFLSFTSEYPSLPLESSDCLISYPLDGEENAVQIDILIAFAGGICCDDQLFVVFFSEYFAQFWVRKEVKADILNDGFKSILFIQKSVL